MTILESIVKAVLSVFALMVVLYVADHFLGTNLFGAVSGGLHAAIDLFRNLFK